MLRCRQGRKKDRRIGVGTGRGLGNRGSVRRNQAKYSTRPETDRRWGATCDLNSIPVSVRHAARDSPTVCPLTSTRPPWLHRLRRTGTEGSRRCSSLAGQRLNYWNSTDNRAVALYAARGKWRAIEGDQRVLYVQGPTSSVNIVTAIARPESERAMLHSWKQDSVSHIID